jgi:hypothetical protein
MLKTALRKFSDRIEVVASTPAKREERWHALLKDKNTEQLVQLVDKDSYEVLKSSILGSPGWYFRDTES